MVTITIANSFSRIAGLSAEDAKALKQLLSYTPSKDTYFSKYPPRPRYLIDKHGNFPTGLLATVETYLKESRIAYGAFRSLPAPSPMGSYPKLNLGPISAYGKQLGAVETAHKVGHGTISMVTGYGKSLTMALLVSKMKLKTLIVVPNVELKRQLSASFNTWFGKTPLIRIENIDSTALKTCTDYDMLILDEVHHGAATTYHKLNAGPWNKIYHRFGFTATPFRNSDDETLLLKSIAGEVIYEVDYHQAVVDDAIVPIEAYYIEMPKIVTEAYTWAQVYSELVVNNKARNEAIALLAARLNSAGLSTLCLVKEVAHGQTLADLTGLQFTHGQDEESRDYIQQFARKELTSLIATTGMAGEGADTKAAEYIIIAGLGKAKSAFQQQIGRGLRKFGSKESAKIIIIKDRSHRFTLRHFNAQRKILLDVYGVVPIKLDL